MDHAEITRRLKAAGQRDPRDAQLGVFTSDLFPGLGAFYWFEDRASLERSLLDEQPFVRSAGDADRQRWGSARSSLIRFLASVDRLHEDETKSASEITNKRYVIDWWGTFDDLLRGEGEYARSLRAEFREYTDDHADESSRESPIRDSETGSFVEYLQTFGH